MRMPICAATPVPTMTAVGVARPRAQGQAMTSTAMPNSSANRKGVWPSGSQAAGKAPVAPAANQATQVSSAAAMTSGTNSEAMRSAKAWREGAVGKEDM